MELIVITVMHHLAMRKNSADAHDLTVGSPFKKILLFSLPLMVTNVLQVLFNMSDIAVVGRFAADGSEAIGSIGSTSIYIMLFTGLLIGLGNGINSLTGRHLGANNMPKVSAIAHTAALVSLGMGLILFGLGAALAKPMLLLLNTKPELLDGALLYVYIYFAGLPGVAVYNFGNGILSADGDTKRPLIFLSAAGVLNVCLNLLFVIVFDMSVAGVALASVISQYSSATLILVALFRTKRPYKLGIRSLKMGGREAKEILALGIPAGLQNSIFATANLFIQAGVNSFDTAMVEGNSASANIDNFVYEVMSAFYMACSSFIAQNYGAGKRKNMLKCYFVSLGYSAISGLVLGVLFVALGRPILSIFTSDPAVIDGGMKRLEIMGYSFGVSAFMDCTIAASRGMGKTVIPTIMVILGSCVFRIIWVYTVFAHFKTIPSLYLLYVVSWALTAVAEIVYFAIIFVKSGKNGNAAALVASGPETDEKTETEENNMKEIVLASGNAGKLAEFRAILKDYNVLSPKDLGIDFDVEETGETFYDNALIKAKALYELCGKPTVADDSGLCVDALGGAPGVYSARYSGGGDVENNKKLLSELSGKSDRRAHFESCIVYYDGNTAIEGTGRTFGTIAFEPDGDGGFGYDPLFISADLGKTFGRASEEEKNSVSHRARALSALAEKLKNQKS